MLVANRAVELGHGGYYCEVGRLKFKWEGKRGRKRQSIQNAGYFQKSVKK
jgi:hypothetical protein